MGLFDSPFLKGKSFSDVKKYVGDYEIVEVKDQKGRVRKRALYKGEWTVIRTPAPAAKRRLWGTLAMAVVVAAVHIRLLLLTHLASGQLLVMVPFLLGLFPVMYLLMGAFSLPFRGRPMRRDQYMHGFIRVSRSAAAVIVCAALGLAASLIFRLSTGNWLFLPEDSLFTALCFVILGLAAGVITLLRSVDLTERPNDAYAPEYL